MSEIRKNILVISAEEQILSFLEKRFSDNFAVSRALNVLEGIEIAGREKPAAIVLDVDGAGIDVMRHIPQLKNTGEGAMVWVLCSKVNFEAARNSLLVGAIGHVLKPYTAKDLEKVVSSIIAGGIPAKEGTQMAVPVQAREVQNEGEWKASKVVRVLAGIMVGIGYLAIPFYLLTFVAVSSCAGVATEYCVKKGGLAYSMSNAGFAYGILFGIVLIPAGISAIIINAVIFITKKRLTQIDMLLLISGAGLVGIAVLSSIANFGRG